MREGWTALALDGAEVEEAMCAPRPESLPVLSPAPSPSPRRVVSRKCRVAASGVRVWRVCGNEEGGRARWKSFAQRLPCLPSFSSASSGLCLCRGAPHLLMRRISKSRGSWDADEDEVWSAGGGRRSRADVLGISTLGVCVFTKAPCLARPSCSFPSSPQPDTRPWIWIWSGVSTPLHPPCFIHLGKH